MYRDRIKDTTTSVGTGAIVLAGVAPTGYQTFAAGFGGSATVAYCMADQTGANWEVGTGTFNGTTGLTRTTVLGSSNSNALVNFTAGTKDVFCTAPASYLLPQGATTQVPFNDGGLPGANENFTYDKTTNTLTVGSITGSALAMTIQPRAPTVLENGGQLQLRGQDATAATRSGGSLNIVAGNGSTTGNGGGITFTTGGGAVGGSITMTVGTSNSGDGANFSMVAGVGQAFGGNFNLTAGSTSAINGVGGSFVMQGGAASNTGGVGGDFTLAAGSGGTGVGARSGTLVFASPVAPTYPVQIGDDGTDSTIRFFADTSGLDLVLQQTTATASSTRTAVIGTVANVGDTYDGYTLAQVVKALRNYGLLA